MSHGYFRRKTRVQASLPVRTAIGLLISVALVNGALAARADCEAFGRAYRDGQSFTLSTGEYGDRRLYICIDGKWNDYQGNLGQRHRAAR
jgi:hypothetical protein